MVIAIDELDKMGEPEKAHQFINDVKGITFGATPALAASRCGASPILRSPGPAQLGHRTAATARAPRPMASNDTRPPQLMTKIDEPAAAAMADCVGVHGRLIRPPAAAIADSSRSCTGTA
jgi:hypothetical protein